MASGFCNFIFWEKVQQRRWIAFLSGFSQLFFLSSVEPRDCSERALWVLAWAKVVTKQLLEPIWFKALGGGFPFWRSIHVAYFVFSPGFRGKAFLFGWSFLHFEVWDGVLALFFVAQSFSFASRKSVDKMRNAHFKPLFLLSWKLLWKNKVVEPRRHWNSTSCSPKTMVIHFTRIEKKGFSNNLSTFSLKCTPQTVTVQLRHCVISKANF